MYIFFPFITGQISFSEFMEGAQKDEWVMNMLKLDVNASGWVMQNCVKMTWALQTGSTIYTERGCVPQMASEFCLFLMRNLMPWA